MAAVLSRYAGEWGTAETLPPAFSKGVQLGRRCLFI